jgi:hypothetical protein
MFNIILGSQKMVFYKKNTKKSEILTLTLGNVIHLVVIS